MIDLDLKALRQRCDASRASGWDTIEWHNAVRAALPALLDRVEALEAALETLAKDCELKGHHPPLDPDSDAEIEARAAYADVGRRLRATLETR
jgi:hypothetical protein